MLSNLIRRITGNESPPGLSISSGVERAIRRERNFLCEVRVNDWSNHEPEIDKEIQLHNSALSGISARRRGKEMEPEQRSALRAIVNEFRQSREEEKSINETKLRFG